MTNEITRDEIESLLNTRIRNLSFYQEALMHKSALKMYNYPRSNERLEFIGDAVLNLIVTKYVFDKFPNENEGFLTKYRMKIVSGKTLSKISKSIGVQNSIRMNSKAMNQKWNLNDRILEDALEALIGAIYLDLGLYHTMQFVLQLISKHIDEKDVLNDTNYKDILMRYTQSISFELPDYKTELEKMNKMFHVKVYINDIYMGEGLGNTKKQAEQNAAQEALRISNVIK